MKRRKFIQHTSLLPFISASVFGATVSNKKELEATSPFVTSREFFYRPENAWAADFIPLYANGEYQLFYLLDWRDKEKHGEGTPWYRISTKERL